jgi:hypothetical protein
MRVIRSGIGREDTLSTRRQPRRTNGATGTEIMHTVASVGGSRTNRRARAWLGTATKRRMWIAVAVASIVTSGLTATAAADSPAPTDDSRSPAPVVDGPLDADTARVDARLVEIGTTREAATRDAADGYTVFRRYGTRGGLKDEFERLAADHPRITKLVTIGETVQGQGHRRPEGDAAGRAAA